MAELPSEPAGTVLAHFIVSDDVERSKRFYAEVLGGRLAFSGLERPRDEVPDAAEAASVRDPLLYPLYPRPGRLSDRGGPDDRPGRRLDAAVLAVGPARLAAIDQSYGVPVVI
jgi:catechol 2,3-dioxygenase-like lactoylglutathione lyase family enzyme